MIYANHIPLYFLPLIMKKASKDSLRQRRGRAGRVQVGLLLRKTGGELKEKRRKDREYKEK